ncbi:MAG TPA: 3-oxoacyl-[acyl-carrier-protein] synthase III C-terminal domain-containing protein [Gemmatimonadales bacterium]|jgi:3-oxoacyl-[acyl-carrier-protein] synthase III|nr:3-oxoacyl-[acyl-carrier-protein] synthase III C-terminal domain-containing protein [Gemmatimonadales bacterium]
MTDGLPDRRTLIESLGVYLPARQVLTEEVLEGCATRPRFPLERLSGIRSRRVAGEGEFGIDLAQQAISRCLAGSKRGPRDVELLISASVGHCDGPGLCISHEPSTSLRLQRRFGFDRAMVFDVASACSGMFTAIAIVDALIRGGAIECGLVVSGEYITHLGTTAQKEIAGPLDPRMACLTLGDAGAAVMLTATTTPGCGFEALDLCTFGAYSRYCVALPTTEPHGGAIMFTDALKLTEAATRHGAAHAMVTVKRAGWAPASFHSLIMHQTSSTALASAMREINRVMKGPVCHAGNTIDNLAERGNTASTTHFVALADNLANGRIRSGDRVVFAVSGSGLTVGTGLYAMDDLPDRFGGAVASAPLPSNGSRRRRPRSTPETPLIRIESVGTAAHSPAGTIETLSLLREAAIECLGRSSYDRRDLGLLIYAGVYRSRFLSEPAIAALLAGELDVNAAMSAEDGRRTLAFDVFNGAVGFLSACYVAAAMIRAGKTVTAMIAASEVENNAGAFPSDLLGIEETGSALILDRARGRAAGFGPFLFKSFTEHEDAYTSQAINRDERPCLRFARDPDLKRYYLAAITSTVTELLASEGLAISGIARILPPQISADFLTRLGQALNVPPDRLVDAMPGDRDLFSSSLPYAFRWTLDRGLAQPGDVGLIITVGSGVQVGCALYYF